MIFRVPALIAYPDARLYRLAGMKLIA